MPRGSLLTYTGGLYHGGGPNTSNGARKGLAFRYNLGWLRQEENMYLMYPPEVAKSFPEPLAHGKPSTDHACSVRIRSRRTRHS